MGELSRQWNPPNGFRPYVAFTLFIELPGREGGATVMPMQHAQLPDGMRWHLRAAPAWLVERAVAAEGASATHEGRPVVPAARIETDAAQRRVFVHLPAAARWAGCLSGRRTHLRHHLGLRRRLPAVWRPPAAWSIGGGDPAAGRGSWMPRRVIVVQ